MKRQAWTPAGFAAAVVGIIGVSAASRSSAPPIESPPPDVAANVTGVCTGCHGLDFIAEHRKDRDGWDFTVRRMIDKGAGLDFEDIPRVVDYLARTYPKPPEKPAE